MIVKENILYGVDPIYTETHNHKRYPIDSKYFSDANNMGVYVKCYVKLKDPTIKTSIRFCYKKNTESYVDDKFDKYVEVKNNIAECFLLPPKLDDANRLNILVQNGNFNNQILGPFNAELLKVEASVGTEKTEMFIKPNENVENNTFSIGGGITRRRNQYSASMEVLYVS